MPWNIENRGGDEPFCVVKSDSGVVEKCYASKEDAEDLLRALFASEPDAAHVNTVNGEDSTGAMVALLPSAQDAERLAVENGEPANVLHLTMAFLGEAADFNDDAREAIRSHASWFANNFEPIRARAFAHATFNPGENQAQVLLIGGDDLAAFLKEANFADYTSVAQHSPHVSHVTLKYGDVEDDIVERMGDIMFDRIRVSFGSHVVDYPMQHQEREIATEVILTTETETLQAEVIDFPMNGEISWSGPIFFEEQLTGDVRIWEENSLFWDTSPFPLPFRWQQESGNGHDNAIQIGRVDAVWRDDEMPGVIFGRGVILPDVVPEAKRYLDLFLSHAAGGVSVDGDSALYEIIKLDETDENSPIRQIFHAMRLRALTAVDIPAFAHAMIKLELAEQPIVASRRRRKPQEEWFLSELCPIIASGIPIDPPGDWFEVELNEPTPITIEDNGRIYGHLALRGVPHLAYGGRKVYMPENCTFQNFHLGSLKTAEGDLIAVGHLTFGGGHADLSLDALDTLRYYDSTSTVGADIRAGYDKFGTWIAGALRPELTPADIRELRSAPLSGDWRPIGNTRDLLIAHAVNVPGFPVTRDLALVASGAPDTTVILTNSPDYCDAACRAQRLEIKHQLANRVAKMNIMRKVS